MTLSGGSLTLSVYQTVKKGAVKASSLHLVEALLDPLPALNNNGNSYSNTVVASCNTQEQAPT